MPAKVHAHVRIISPASLDQQTAFPSRLQELEHAGLTVSYHKLSPDPSWPFTSGTRQDRLKQLTESLLDPKVQFLLSSRGGYGVSDLLDGIPWDHLNPMRPKVIVGFSDISALHSAFYSKLAWPGLHAPMPATDYWGQNDRRDISALIDLLRGHRTHIALPVLYEGRGLPPEDVRGLAFGGCLAVLSNLIGTPYFPKSLQGHIVFWEDIGEHPGRILRYVNQWQQSGALDGVHALILGRFVGCEMAGAVSESQLREAISQRLNIPVWFCPEFGHCSPNWPLPIGLPLAIASGRLQWDIGDKSSLD